MKKIIAMMSMIVAGAAARAEMCPNMEELVHVEIRKMVLNSYPQVESINVSIGSSTFRDAWVYSFSFLDEHGWQLLGDVMVDTATCKIASIGYGATGKLPLTEK